MNVKTILPAATVLILMEISLLQEKIPSTRSGIMKALVLKSDLNTIQKLNALTKRKSYKLSQTELQIYQGVYTLENKIDIVLKIQDGKLWAIVPDPA